MLYSYIKTLKHSLKLTFLCFFSRKHLRTFRLKGIKFRNFNANSLFRGAKTDFTANWLFLNCRVPLRVSQIAPKVNIVIR